MAAESTDALLVPQNNISNNHDHIGLLSNKNKQENKENNEEEEEKKQLLNEELDLKERFINCCCGVENEINNDIDNDHITTNDFECRQVGILWAFLVAQAGFGVIKYGPLVSENYGDNNCSIYSELFSTQCDWRWIYLAQCILYVLFMVAFCRGPNYRFVVAKQIKKPDVLLFPFVILGIMGFVEFVYTIIYFDKHHGWFIAQLITDVCGYALFYSYAPILGKLPHFCDKIERRTLMAHIMFAFIAAFAIIWLSIAMFVNDFVFQIQNSNAMAIVQIILESIVVIEWVHVVFECWMHKDFDEDNNDEEHNDNHDKVTVDVARAVLLDHEINWNIAFYAAFVMEIFGFLFALFKALPVESVSCSNFEIGFDSWNTCRNERWIVQFVLYVIAVAILMARFSVMPKQQFKLFQFRRLYFPFIIWMILMLIECLYVYVVNKYYMVQVGIDFFGYLAMFIQAIFVIIMRIYNNGDGGNPCCAKKLKWLQLISWTYFISCILVIIWNFAVDIRAVQHAAKVLSEHYKNVTESTVESIAFIQIVFENVLLTEYLHVLFGSIKHEKYVANGKINN
eukprot:221902_1